MEIFNIFSVSEPFKTAASGSGIGTPYTIQYNMSVMGTELDGTRYIRNYGKGGNSFNAEAFASNHIYLNGTTQSVPYAITGGTSVAYYDVATKSFVTDTASNPYTITVPHSVLFSYTSVLEDVDITALNADPDLAFRMFLDGEVLPSGFSRANDMIDCNFYGGNEGIASGAYVQDLSVALGADVVINGTFDTDTDWNKLNGTTIAGGVATVVGSGSLAGSSSNWSLNQTEILIPSKYYIVELSVRQTVGTGNFLISVEWVQFYDEQVGSEFSTITAVFIAEAQGTSDRICFGGITDLDEFEVDNVVIKEASVVEIEAYDTATRTTLANQSYGASNLKLIQDGSGRTTGTALANTTQWKADGRTAVTNWTITAPFTIGEIIDGDPYIFTSNGDRFKNLIFDGTYTIPTGVWTLDEFGFDGVTPVTARGVTGMVDEVLIP